MNMNTALCRYLSKQKCKDTTPKKSPRLPEKCLNFRKKFEEGNEIAGLVYQTLWHKPALESQADSYASSRISLFSFPPVI